MSLTRLLFATVTITLSSSLGFSAQITGRLPVTRYIRFDDTYVLAELGDLLANGSFRSYTATMYEPTYLRMSPEVMAAVDGRTIDSTVSWPNLSAPTSDWSVEGFSFDSGGRSYSIRGGTYHEVRVAGVEKNPRLLNVSTRAYVPAGSPLIVGTVVRGGSVNVLIRAIGPSLAPLGLPDFLPDPTIEIVNADGVTIASDDDWSRNDAAAKRDAFTSVGAFALENGTKDAALMITLKPGAYTFVMRSVDGRAGVALAEAYLLPGSTGRFVNLSTRGFVGTEDRMLIAGFVVDPVPGAKRRVLLRGVGPELAAMGVAGAVADPVISLVKDKVELQKNDNAVVGDARISAHVGAFPLTETYTRATYIGGYFYAGTKSAVLQGSLDGGAHTLLMSANGAPGTGLVELYEYQD